MLTIKDRRVRSVNQFADDAPPEQISLSNYLDEKKSKLSLPSTRAVLLLIGLMKMAKYPDHTFNVPKVKKQDVKVSIKPERPGEATRFDTEGPDCNTTRRNRNRRNTGYTKRSYYADQ